VTRLPEGLVLPRPPQPAGAYRPARLIGDMLYLASFGPRDEAGAPIPGMIGRDFDLAQGKLLARNVGGSILAVVQEALGSLDRVRQVVKVTGMVWAVPDFTQHPKIVDGCSELLVEVFGERGIHVRAAFGVYSLPFGVPVSIECVMQVVV
jgi:enamine deaminase RidA (YjgF/YER057c/UK114 family)